MITLTYPDLWEAVAPSAKATHRHLDLLFKRWDRKWCSSHPPRKPSSHYCPEAAAEWEAVHGGHACPTVPLVWKLEFQRRGAPHFHILVPHPPYTRIALRRWLSATWVDIVGHPDPTERAKHQRAGTGIDRVDRKNRWTGAEMSDPRKLASYFLKHGSGGAKDYQHHAPESWLTTGGAGRFWGYRGLKPLVVQVPLDRDSYMIVRRTIRRYASRRVDWYEIRHDLAGSPLGHCYPHLVAIVTHRHTIPGKELKRDYIVALPTIVTASGEAAFVDPATGEVSSSLTRIHTVTCVRLDTESGEHVPVKSRTRRVTRRARPIGGTGHRTPNGAWISVPDGPAFATDLAKLVSANRHSSPDSVYRKRRIRRAAELSGKPVARLHSVHRVVQAFRVHRAKPASLLSHALAAVRIAMLVPIIMWMAIRVGIAPWASNVWQCLRLFPGPIGRTWRARRSAGGADSKNRTNRSRRKYAKTPPKDGHKEQQRR